MKRIFKHLLASFCIVLILSQANQGFARSNCQNSIRAALDSPSQVKYFYQGGQISSVDSASQVGSFLLVGNDRVVRLAQSNALANQQHTYYLGDAKNQDLLVDGQALDNQQALTTGAQTSADYQGYGQLNGQGNENGAMHFGYDGEYQDGLTGLSYLRARDYSAQTQRFMTMDSYPLLNRYHFTDQDPINQADPSGHMSQQVAGILAAGGVLLAGAALTWAGASKVASMRQIEDLKAQLDSGGVAQEAENQTPSHPNSIKAAAFIVGSSPAIIATAIEKHQSHASTLNMLLSISLPTIAAAFGTYGMITNSYWAQAVDNAIEGMSFPIINSNTMSGINPLDMVFGAVSGAASGYFGGYFAQIGLQTGGGYANAAAAFFTRGVQMEMIRSAVYNLGELISGNESGFNVTENLTQVALSGVPLAIEGLIMYPTEAGVNAASNTNLSLFLYGTAFSGGGSVMQIGWPYVGNVVQSLFN